MIMRTLDDFSGFKLRRRHLVRWECCRGRIPGFWGRQVQSKERTGKNRASWSSAAI